MHTDIPYFSHIVLQPTTLCNLNCSYCYLPERLLKKRMSTKVTQAIADDLTHLPQRNITLVWHGGEPLMYGPQKFRELIAPFSEMRKSGKVTHSIQTNATLISKEWCDLFIDEKFRIGVSIDGNENQNAARVTWAGGPSFSKIIHGIELLKKYSIEFGVIAVVNSQNIDDPSSFYDFFVSLGCNMLNVNIEEKEGLNRFNNTVSDERVRKFWRGLFEAWRANPSIRIREFDRTLGWLKSFQETEGREEKFARNFWPTVTVDGDVVVLSPEFSSAIDEEGKNKFVIGNVLHAPLHEIVANSTDAWYVKQFRMGVVNCKEACQYFGYCRGGEASNKYFELRNIEGTETVHCRQTRQFVLDAVLESLAMPVSYS